MAVESSLDSWEGQLKYLILFTFILYLDIRGWMRSLQIITGLGLFPRFGHVGAVEAIWLFDKRKNKLFLFIAISQLSL